MPYKHSPCIINLDDLGNKGTHWVCCYSQRVTLAAPKGVKINKTLYYFDYFGMHYPEEYKQRAIKDNLNVIYNKNQVQDIKSVLCGYYCLYVLHRALIFNESFNKILSRFKSPKYNEQLIKHYFLG